MSVYQNSDMTRDHPFNVDDNGEKMTACHYKMRTVRRGRRVKLSGSDSPSRRPGANGRVPRARTTPVRPGQSMSGQLLLHRAVRRRSRALGSWYTDINDAVVANRRDARSSVPSIFVRASPW